MKLVCAVMATLVLCGCQTMNRTINKVDHSHDYLHTENYQGNKMNIPNELSSGNIHELYPIPEVPGNDSLAVPTISPPENKQLAMGNS